MSFTRSFSAALAALCIHAEAQAQKFHPINLKQGSASLVEEADIVLGKEEISFRDLENRIYRAADLNRDGAITVLLNGTLVSSPATGCALRLYRSRTILRGAQGARIVNSVASDGSATCGLEATKSSVVQIAADEIEISGLKIESTGNFSTGVLLLAGTTPRSLKRLENVEITVRGESSAGIFLGQASTSKTQMPSIDTISFAQVKALGRDSRGIEVQEGSIAAIRDVNIEVGNAGKGVYTLLARGLSIGRLERVNVLASGLDGYSLGIHGYGIREIDNVQVVLTGNQGVPFMAIGTRDPSAPELSVNALTLTSGSSFSTPAFANQPIRQISGVWLKSPGQMHILAPRAGSIKDISADYLTIAIPQADTVNKLRSKGLSISGVFSDVSEVTSNQMEVTNAVITNLRRVSIMGNQFTRADPFGYTTGLIVMRSSIENLTNLSIDMNAISQPIFQSSVVGFLLDRDSLIGSLIGGEILVGSEWYQAECLKILGEVYYQDNIYCL
jgi:hypothetical protein